MGNTRQLLTLNQCVLCGDDPRTREEYQRHLDATARRFYGQGQETGIAHLAEWYADHKNKSIWQLTGGIYCHILSEPQLFIEGNHRTGTLIISYLLAARGLPPFILSPDNAADYFDLSAKIKNTHRTGLRQRIRLHNLSEAMAEFLEDQTDDDYRQPSTDHARLT